jgi:hypothetical protein
MSGRVDYAVQYPLTRKCVPLMELVSTWDAGRLIGPKAHTAPTVLLSCVLGIEYMATDKFSLALGVQIDLAGKDTTANVTPYYPWCTPFDKSIRRELYET